MSRSYVLFQVCPDKIDEIFGQFGGDLFLGAVGEMEANVRLQHLAHEAVDASTNSGEKHKLVSTIFLGGEGALNGVELSAQFTNSLQQLQFFPFVVGHDESPMNRMFLD